MNSGSEWCDEVDSDLGLALLAFCFLPALFSGRGSGLSLPSSKINRNVILEHFTKTLQSGNLTSLHCQLDMAFGSCFVKH